MIETLAGSRPAAIAAWRSRATALLGSQPARGRGLSTEQDGGMRLLLRFGKEPDRIEINEFAMKFSLLLRPQSLHCQYAFAQ